MVIRAFLAIVLSVALAANARAGTELTAYTDLEPDILSRYSKDLAARFPDIHIKWVRESGGPITARLLAEKDNPQADIIFGLALSGVLAVDRVGGLDSYRPAGFEALDPMMRDSRDNPTWVGQNIVVGAVALNTRELDALKLPYPETWADLTRPEYKGAIVMPNPVSSGTAYLHVISWLQNMGEEKAWAFMEALHKNVTMYVHSGSKPGQIVAMGESPIGLTVDAYIAPYIKKRAPIVSFMPRDGVGYDIVACALIKGGRNPEGAKRIMDYAVSMDSARIGLEMGYLPVWPDFDTQHMADIRSLLLPMDLPKAAEVRDQVLAEWRRRFGGD